MNARSHVASVSLVVILTLASAAQAQTPPRDDGWSKFGKALGGNSDDAYLRGAMMQAEFQANIEAARAARADEQLQMVEARWRDDLAKAWENGGLSPSEASAVAAVYKLDYAQQLAVAERVKRDGWASGIDAAWKAYGDYNYQLANQLLVAAQVVFQTEQKRREGNHASEAGAANQSSGR